MSKKTWDYLTTSSRPSDRRASPLARRSRSAASSRSPARSPRARRTSCRVGSVTPTGPIDVEQLDADGGVLQTRKFGAVNKLGPIGNATSKGDKRIVTKDAAFSLQVPALPAARSLRIRRGEDVLLLASPLGRRAGGRRCDAGARRDRRQPDAQLDGDRRRRRHAHLAGLDLARRWPDAGARWATRPRARR